MSFSYLVDLANESGGVLYLMLIMLFIALTVIIDRWRYLANMRKVGDQVIDLCQQSSGLDLQKLLNLQKTHSDIPAVKLLSVAITGERAHLVREELAGNLEEAIMHEAPNLDKAIWALDTVITLAPLLGLFGTIVGMFNAFSVLTDIQNSASQVTGGIAEALVSTAFGLLIAMIGLLFFNHLNTRIRELVHQMETLKIMILNRQNIFKNI